ncbi:PrgI family protein [Patescibacteria group bacterium]|nr:MAG: PrgI family protein [Patescibacteria group bacterium]
MRVTAIPAQVTTVEDRIMGSLGFSQILLCVLPLFVGAGLFILLPPVMHTSLYKYMVVGIIALICGILAIRIRGKIILLWLITITRYNLRPKYYVFQKSIDHREEYTSLKSELSEQAQTIDREITSSIPKLAFHDAAHVLETINKPESNLRFEMTKKGGLYVRLTEIED